MTFRNYLIQLDTRDAQTMLAICPNVHAPAGFWYAVQSPELKLTLDDYIVDYLLGENKTKLDVNGKDVLLNNKLLASAKIKPAPKTDLRIGRAGLLINTNWYGVAGFSVKHSNGWHDVEMKNLWRYEDRRVTLRPLNTARALVDAVKRGR